MAVGVDEESMVVPHKGSISAVVIARDTLAIEKGVYWTYLENDYYSHATHFDERHVRT